MARSASFITNTNLELFIFTNTRRRWYAVDHEIQVVIQLFIFRVCEAFYCNQLVTQIVALLLKKLFVCCDV